MPFIDPHDHRTQLLLVAAGTAVATAHAGELACACTRVAIAWVAAAPATGGVVTDELEGQAVGACDESVGGAGDAECAEPDDDACAGRA